MAVLPNAATGPSIPAIKLEGFLADHSSRDNVVEIRVEPSIVYSEMVGRDSYYNFDFKLTGLTDRTLDLVFLKVAAYDDDRGLVAYRYLNRNAVGPSGIETLGQTRIEGRAALDVFNPFHTFPTDIGLTHLRYMFTFRDLESGEEFYFGDVQVDPQNYVQQVSLGLPVRGLVTVVDGYDYFSHHRRFAMSIAREATRGAMQQNFARFALDFVHIGETGTLDGSLMRSGSRTTTSVLSMPDASIPMARLCSHREAEWSSSRRMVTRICTRGYLTSMHPLRQVGFMILPATTWLSSTMSTSTAISSTF